MTPSKSVRMALCLQILILATAAAYSVESEHFCGPRLTEMMQIVCRNRYASHRYTAQKRSGTIELMSFERKIITCRKNLDEDNAYMDNDEPLTYPASPYQFYPFSSGFGSTTALSQRFRRDLTAVKRGVIEECCRKPCSLLVLSTYCGV